MPALIAHVIEKAGWQIVRDQIGLILGIELTNQKALGTFDDDFELYVESSIPYDSSSDILMNVLVGGATYGNMTQQDAQGRTIYMIDFHTAAEQTVSQTGSTVSALRIQSFINYVMFVFRSPFYRTLGIQPGYIGGTYVEQFQILDPHQKEDLDFTRFGRVTIAVRIQENTEFWQGVELIGNDTGAKLDLTEKGYKFVYDKYPQT